MTSSIIDYRLVDALDVALRLGCITSKWAEHKRSSPTGLSSSRLQMTQVTRLDNVPWPHLLAPLENLFSLLGLFFIQRWRGVSSDGRQLVRGLAGIITRECVCVCHCVDHPMKRLRFGSVPAALTEGQLPHLFPMNGPRLLLTQSGEMETHPKYVSFYCAPPPFIHSVELG